MDYASLNAYLSPQNLLLIVLIIVAAWAVVELALTLRKARKAVDDITRSANETIEQVQPIIAKLDGAMDDLQPTLKEVQPLVEKVALTVDEANVSLAKVNGILGDVSEVSGTATAVSNSVKNATAAAASGVAGFVGRIAKGESAPSVAAITEGASAASKDEAHDGADSDSEVASSYVTYGPGKEVTEEPIDEAAANAAKPESQQGGDDMRARSSVAKSANDEGRRHRRNKRHRSAERARESVDAVTLNANEPAEKVSAHRQPVPSANE